MNKIAFFALMLALGLVGGCGNKKEEKKRRKRFGPDQPETGQNRGESSKSPAGSL
ncbi:MAG: hypothetical protein ACLUHB_11460 [Odoribacter splanchnicus]